MEDVGLFYGRWVYFTSICEILWSFEVVSCNLVYFTRFGILYREKSGSPVCDDLLSCHLSPNPADVLKLTEIVSSNTWITMPIDTDHLSLSHKQSKNFNGTPFQ
jgi:hypothetical protein